ncbi:MAG TPA: TonB-dependent receptor [Candidatus Krumholzibacteriaceae bacterium]
MKVRYGSPAPTCIVAIALVLALSASALAQTGHIIGKVSSAKTSEPLAFANVVVIGTKMGGMTLNDGSFKITGVPVGSYTVKAMMMGYTAVEKTGISVNSGGEVTVEFQLQETIVSRTAEIVVEATVPQINVTSSDVRQRVTGSQLRELPVDDVVSAVALKSGIVKTGDELHVRGGRSGEVQMQIDGVPVDDPLGGGSISVGLLATDQSEVITGGMDAEYGNAQSAIINVSTREGGKNFEGQLRYMTDDFGRSDKTYTNYDRLNVGFGGPTPLKNLTYYASGEVTFSDGDNWSIASKNETKIFGDWLKFSDRQFSSYNLQGKVAYQINPRIKIVGEAIFTHSVNDPYVNNWNIDGYAQKIYRFITLRASRDYQADYARAFGAYTSVYYGPWIKKVIPRVEYYPGSIEERRRVIYPVVVFNKVRDPNDPSKPAFITRYDNFYARMVTDVYGQETEVIWDEAIINGSGNVERYESKLLFEGYQNPESHYSHFRDDSSYVYFNSAERISTNKSDDLNLKFGLSHNISDDVLYTVSFTRLRFKQINSVNGKTPAEYSSAGLPATLPSGSWRYSGVSTRVWYTDPDYPYFVTSYDWPAYTNRLSTTYNLKADLTSKKWMNHQFKTGVQFLYNDLDEETINFPAQTRIDGSYLSSNIFHNFNPEASYYVQDKWQYQGMIVNGGVRVDFFSPGNNSSILIHSSEINPNVDKYKFQISPRLGFAFPITDKDKFHFHYGRFTQWPNRNELFRTQNMLNGSGILGNPDLNEELTVSYQAGVSHQFTETVAGQFVVFNKDIYGLVSSTRVTDTELGIQGYRYINRTYASSRGLEVSIDKMRTHYVGGEISYTFSYADGVASDANFGVTAEGLSHLPTQELPLDWDQRHTLNVTVRLQDQNKWGATIVYSYGSGLPWTPYDRFARRQDPLWENSKRLPATNVINLQGRKMFSIYGQELTLFFEGRNLLNQDILTPGGTAPGAFPGMTNASMDNGSYLTETGQYGGAYLEDINQDGVDEFVPVHDPTIWDSRKAWRIGFGFDF